MSRCSKNPATNYKNIKAQSKLCCPHMAIKATKWRKLTSRYYVKTCCNTCASVIKNAIKSGKTYKIEGNKLMRFEPNKKKFETVFKLLTKSQINKTEDV